MAITKKVLETQIETLLSEVYSELQSLNELNFSKDFNRIVTKLNFARKLQNDLNLQGKIELSVKNEKIKALAQLISQKYDNLVNDWKQKVQEAKRELELLQNQKKLTSYIRWENEHQRSWTENFC